MLFLMPNQQCQSTVYWHMYWYYFATWKLKMQKLIKQNNNNYEQSIGAARIFDCQVKIKLYFLFAY